MGITNINYYETYNHSNSESCWTLVGRTTNRDSTSYYARYLFRLGFTGLCILLFARTSSDEVFDLNFTIEKDGTMPMSSYYTSITLEAILCTANKAFTIVDNVDGHYYTKEITVGSWTKTDTNWPMVGHMYSQNDPASVLYVWDNSKLRWYNTQVQEVNLIIFLEKDLWSWKDNLPYENTSAFHNRYPVYKKNGIYYRTAGPVYPTVGQNYTFLTSCGMCYSYNNNANWENGHLSLYSSDRENYNSTPNGGTTSLTGVAVNYVAKNVGGTRTFNANGTTETSYTPEEFLVPLGANSAMLSVIPYDSSYNGRGFYIRNSQPIDTAKYKYVNGTQITTYSYSRNHPFILWDDSHSDNWEPNEYIEWLDQFTLWIHTACFRTSYATCDLIEKYRIPLNFEVHCYWRSGTTLTGVTAESFPEFIDAETAFPYPNRIWTTWKNSSDHNHPPYNKYGLIMRNNWGGRTTWADSNQAFAGFGNWDNTSAYTHYADYIQMWIPFNGELKEWQSSLSGFSPLTITPEYGAIKLFRTLSFSSFSSYTYDTRTYRSWICAYPWSAETGSMSSSEPNLQASTTNFKILYHISGIPLIPGVADPTDSNTTSGPVSNHSAIGVWGFKSVDDDYFEFAPYQFCHNNCPSAALIMYAKVSYVEQGGIVRTDNTNTINLIYNTDSQYSHYGTFKYWGSNFVEKTTILDYTYLLVKSSRWSSSGITAQAKSDGRNKDYRVVIVAYPG